MSNILKIEDEDGIMFRSSFSEIDRVLRFGPVETSLDDLVDKGFGASVFFSWFEIRNNHRGRVYLSRGSERYLIAKRTFKEVSECCDLFGYIKNGVQMIGRLSIKPDIWESVTAKYPPLPRPEVWIGNMTLKEWVIEELAH